MMTSCGGFGNLVQNLCNPSLGCEYGTYTCKVSVVDDDNNLMYKMFLTHGYGSSGRLLMIRPEGSQYETWDLKENYNTRRLIVP